MKPDLDELKLLRDGQLYWGKAPGRAVRLAEKEWHERAEAAVRELCAAAAPFTSDDVWFRMEYAPAPTRGAMSAVMRRAQKAGWCLPTARWTAGTHPLHLGRPRRVWEPQLPVELEV